MKIVLASSLARHLEDTADDIAAGDPESAISFVRELRQALQSERAPRAFPLLPRFEHFGIQYRDLGQEIILQVEEPGRPVILALVYSSEELRVRLLLAEKRVSSPHGDDFAAGDRSAVLVKATGSSQK